MDELSNFGSVWIDKHRYDSIERLYYEKLACNVSTGKKSANASKNMKQSRPMLQDSDAKAVDGTILNACNSTVNAPSKAEEENELKHLRKDFEQLKTTVKALEKLVKQLDQKLNVNPSQSLCVGVESASSKRANISLLTSNRNDDCAQHKMNEIEPPSDKCVRKKSKKSESDVICKTKSTKNEAKSKNTNESVRQVEINGLAKDTRVDEHVAPNSIVTKQNKDFEKAIKEANRRYDDLWVRFCAVRSTSEHRGEQIKKLEKQLNEAKEEYKLKNRMVDAYKLLRERNREQILELQRQLGHT